MSSRNIITNFEEFPHDDRHWMVRWVDGYLSYEGRTSTPSVGVKLCPVSSNPTKQEICKPANLSEEILVRVHTGMVPELVLGSIYKNGRLIGRANAQTIHINADLTDKSTRIVKAKDIMLERPSWWKDEYPYRWIGQSEYSLGKDFSNSHCVVIQQAQSTYIIPCHEVFRALMAPSSQFALALTTGPWATTMENIVNTQKTGKISDNEWLVVLRKRIKDGLADHAANLTISEHGKQTANAIYANFLKTTGESYIYASIPFLVKNFRFSVRSVQIQSEPKKHLCWEIISATWPYSNLTIHHHRDNSGNTAKDIIESDKSEPWSSANQNNNASKDDEVSISSKEDPAANSGLDEIFSLGVDWKNKPELRKIEKEVSYKYLSGKVTPIEKKDFKHGTSGLTTHGITVTKEVSAEQVAQKNMPYRFIQLRRMLELLHENKIINNLHCYQPQQGGLFRDNILTWPLPKRVIDEHQKEHKRGKWVTLTGLVRRSILVYHFEYNAEKIFLLEIECRENEGGYCTLLLKIAEDNYQETIKRVINHIAFYRGNLKSAERKIRASRGVLDMKTWVHAYYKKQNSSSFIKPLNHVSFTNALKTLTGV
ncbi:hypothetical protein [Halomonas sp. N3-2A]|uniref:hypothetical protein n=1 Tax=Halomonas sp. N3-2A TaxID=2014541 RepID=UPI000B5B4469|nr:hypothetical protein [Halomonas sp. N3-2A]ASK21211.1 hypothetical protein CEK60_18745 [Halomonas sp. N3-2A]